MNATRRAALSLVLALVVPLLTVLGTWGTAMVAQADARSATAVVAGAPAPAEGRPAAPVEAEPGAAFGPDWQENIRAFAADNAVQVGARVVIAILLFIVGWVVAKGLSYAILQLLSRTDLDNRLAQRLGITMLLRKRGEGETEGQLERLVAKIVYYILMLLVVVGVLEFAGLSQVAGPIENLVDTVLRALPRIGEAALILGAAYVAGRILMMVVTAFLDRVGVDDRFAELSEERKAAEAQPFSQAAGRIVFWLIMVLGLAGAFEALDIEPIAQPLHNAIDHVIAIVPRLGVAVLLVAAGWYGGRIVRTILRNVLHSVGFDKLAAKVQLDKVTGKTSPSDVVAIAVMVFIILQASIAALNEIGLETLSVPLTSMMSQFWNILPPLAVSILIVVIGVIVGQLLQRVVAAGLRNVGLDRFMDRLGFQKLSAREDRLGEYSELVGFVVYIAVILLAVAQALENLELTTWALHLNAFLAYLVKNVVVAILVVGVGFAIGNYVRDLIRARRPDEEAGRWIAEFARYAILVFAFTMAVRQLDVAEDFVLMTFGLLFGALCLAAALAFGLGGRDVAGDIVKRQYDEAQKQLGSRPRPPTPPGGSGSSGGPTPPVVGG